MRCSQSLCSDCITKLDGINHCHACMARLGREVAPTREHEAAGAVPEMLAITGGFAVLSALAWWMLEVLLPGSAGP